MNYFLKTTLIATTAAISLCACDNKAPDQSLPAPVSKVESSAELATSGRPSEVDTLIDSQSIAFIRLEPLLASDLAGDVDAMGGAYNHRLPDYSPAGMKTVRDLMRKALADLEGLDASNYDGDTHMHIEILKAIRSFFAGTDRFAGGYIDTWAGHLPYIVNQISGPLIAAPNTMQNRQSLENLDDADDYLLRLAALGNMIDSVNAKMMADADAGIILPKKLFPKTLLFVDNFTGFAPAEHPLVQKFRLRLGKADNIDPAQIDKRVAKATILVSEVVYPAYRAVKTNLLSLQEKAPEGDGIWVQPGGRDYYRHALRFLGDTNSTADEVHQIGLEEVDRISGEMDAILVAQGLTEGTVGERMSSLEDDPKFFYPDSDEGREQLLSDLRRWTEEVMVQAPNLFASLPTQGIEVKRVPIEEQASSAGGSYNSPSLDGTRPGTFWINLRDMKANPRYGLKTLTYHEAVPGHHFQIALNMAQENIGLDRKNAPFNAYAEGWGLYAEQVAAEMGMYEDDPYGDLGRLQAEIYRAVRLVVDTGLHHKKWTREEAIDYMIRNTGSAESDITSAIERYMAWPGQALGYKIGMLKIVELREMAKIELGDDFDIREFHDVVLLPGGVPLSVLEANVRGWIAAYKS
jgi:uncharacterized protein (DUF885 family)